MRSNLPLKRGIGMALVMHGSGVAGLDMASVTIKINDDGSFNLLTGSTDNGTGSDTILAQIAAEPLVFQLKISLFMPQIQILLPLIQVLMLAALRTSPAVLSIKQQQKYAAKFSNMLPPCWE
jgi:hypothetical protein